MQRPVHWGWAERVQRQSLLGTKVGLLLDRCDFLCRQGKIPQLDLGRLQAHVKWPSYRKLCLVLVNKVEELVWMKKEGSLSTQSTVDQTFLEVSIPPFEKNWTLLFLFPLWFNELVKLYHPLIYWILKHFLFR